MSLKCTCIECGADLKFSFKVTGVGEHLTIYIIPCANCIRQAREEERADAEGTDE